MAHSGSCWLTVKIFWVIVDHGIVSKVADYQIDSKSMHDKF